MIHAPRVPRAAVIVRVMLVLAIAGLAPRAGAVPPLRPGESLAESLATWKLDAARREPLAAAGPWNDDKQSFVLRLLARLKMSPDTLALRWLADAADVSAGLPTTGGDTLVKVVGRAVFVAPQPLSSEQAEIAGNDHLDVVRIVTAAGQAVDVVVAAAPRAWPRWRAIDEPAAAIGLPLAPGPGPAPAAADGVWPAEAATVVLLGARVSWFPPTVLGRAGMDYGTFDTVADGQPLVAGDTEAFYGLLAAVAAVGPEPLAAAAASAPDIVTLIDPARKWFADHRGDAVAVEGIARKVTRIAIDDPVRRRQVGTDHYWELYVFVSTPLIQIDKQLQDDFPVVCCVRSLPAGMPTGDRVGERVRVEGFGLKRYGYQLPKVKITSSQGDSEQKARRRETPLIIAEGVAWTPSPSPQTTMTTLGWIFFAIAGAIGLGLALAALAFQRDSRREARKARAAMPERIELPPSE
jgi:hypothetical protein